MRACALAGSAALPQCLQFKTDQQADLKKLERLNNLFFALMSKGDVGPGARQRGAAADALWRCTGAGPAC